MNGKGDVNQVERWYGVKNTGSHTEHKGASLKPSHHRQITCCQWRVWLNFNIHGFCICRLNQPQIKNIQENNSRKLQKRKLEFASCGKYLHSIYVVLAYKYPRDDLKYTKGCLFLICQYYTILITVAL